MKKKKSVRIVDIHSSGIYGLAKQAMLLYKIAILLGCVLLILVIWFLYIYFK
jgi:hypothetical protein